MIIYKFIKNLLLHLQYTKILNKVYKDENLLYNLSQLFGTTFKKDWIGRTYTVINPNIVNGKYDEDSQIYEYGSRGLDNSAYIEKVIMEKLIATQQFITANNLFDLLTYDIRKIDDHGNYLFIIQPITLEDVLKSLKHFSILILVLVIIIICANLIF
jgi:hypothetical protein